MPTSSQVSLLTAALHLPEGEQRIQTNSLTRLQETVRSLAIKIPKDNVSERNHIKNPLNQEAGSLEKNESTGVPAYNKTFRSDSAKSLHGMLYDTREDIIKTMVRSSNPISFLKLAEQLEQNGNTSIEMHNSANSPNDELKNSQHFMKTSKNHDPLKRYFSGI